MGGKNVTSLTSAINYLQSLDPPPEAFFTHIGNFYHRYTGRTHVTNLRQILSECRVTFGFALGVAAEYLPIEHAVKFREAVLLDAETEREIARNRYPINTPPSRQKPADAARSEATAAVLALLRPPPANGLKTARSDQPE